MRENVLYHIGVSGVALICLLVMPSQQSICGREGICTIYLFIYFIKTPKIGEIHVQYINNINIT